jgi:hypothetical protein
MPPVEERVQRLERDLQKIQPIPEALRQEQQVFIEAQKLGEVERSRQMTVWEQEFVDQRTLIEKQAVRLREFETRHEAVGRTLKALEEFQAQVVHSQKQVSELQRLAEERQRKELAEWQGENEQRWKKETLRWDYTIQEQQKVNQKVIERFPPLEKQLTQLLREVEALWRAYEGQGSLQLQNAQRLLDSISGSLASRPKAE